MTREEQIERARDVTQSRILTQEEFKQVRKRQLQKLVQLDPKAHRKGKRKAESDKVCIDDVDTQRYYSQLLLCYKNYKSCLKIPNLCNFLCLCYFVQR